MLNAALNLVNTYLNEVKFWIYIVISFKQNRGEPGALGNIRLGVDLLIKGPEPAGEYLGGNQETAFNRPSPRSDG